MKISTQTDVLANRLGDHRAVEIIARSGFDAVDYSMFFLNKNTDHPLKAADYEKYLLSLRKTAEDNGVCFNQAHAPFPSFRAGDDEYNRTILPELILSIEAAGILGAQTIIVHPSVYPENMKENNLELYNSLAPYCKQYNVKVALENMFGYDPVAKRICKSVCSTGKELAEYADALDPAYFTVCLDIGHAGLVGETAQGMIRDLGHSRLTALHVHDNDFITDRHVMPYLGKLDWDAITAALKEIDYSGDFTLEADNFTALFPDELLEDATKLMFAAAKHLVSKITD